MGSALGYALCSVHPHPYQTLNNTEKGLGFREHQPSAKTMALKPKPEALVVDENHVLHLNPRSLKPRALLNPSRFLTGPKP